MSERSFYVRWGRYLLLVALAIPLYIWSWRTADINLVDLIQGAPKARPIISDLVRPSLLARERVTLSVSAVVRVPCDAPPPEPPPAEGPTLTLSATCLNARDSLVVSGSGFRPNTPGRLYWRVAGLEGRLRDEPFETDAQGRFTVETDIPPLLAQQGGDHTLEAELKWEAGALRPSETLRTTIDKMIETVFLALMATTFGGLVAIPLSFLGARNLMPTTPWGTTLYVAVRSFFNTARSIEPLILATIFAIWVGFGPFAGVLALSVHTIASLGKLYSEAAENIDPGPIEAIRSTGANEWQVIWYGVVPQIVPPYVSFTVYHWDINVRMSTIIGFVGGGGIGLELQRWINQLQWNSAATAVWAIVLVVSAMDYASAIVRERLV